MRIASTSQPLASALLLILSTGVSTLPIGPSPERSADSPLIECRLKLIAMDMGAHEYDTEGGLNYSSPAWMCCDPAADLDAPEDDCPLLYGADLSRLRVVDAGQVVRLRDLNYGSVVSANSISSSELSAATLKAFGGETKTIYRPEFVNVPNNHHSFNGVDSQSPGRSLQEGGTGATWIDRSFAHGQRAILSVIVGTADPGNGDARSWGTVGCSITQVRKQMFGHPEGYGFTVGASPWAVKEACRTTDTCKYNLRDHVRHLSRTAVLPNGKNSKELYLPVVKNWPADFCNWSGIWKAVYAAIVLDGQYDITAFNHVIAFVPKHCAIGVGSLPGKFSIVNQCPGTSVRGHIPIVAAHELGHNLGFHHSGIIGQGEYHDLSSMMGYAGANRSPTLNMAHRHMFHWLFGLPDSVRTETASNSLDRTFTAKLGDPNQRGKPHGSFWAVEIHDGARSWYVAYRSCSGYDFRSATGWCGKVQISHRDDGSTHGFHYGFLSAAGESISFGSSNFITATTLSQVPLTLPTSTGAVVEVRLRINRSV